MGIFFQTLLFSIVAFLLIGCHSLKIHPKTGNEKYCLVDYEKHTVDCSYTSMKACRERYKDTTAKVCFPREALTSQTIEDI